MIDVNRKCADFDAVTMENVGRYLHMTRAEPFNPLLLHAIDEILNGGTTACSQTVDAATIDLRWHVREPPASLRSRRHFDLTPVLAAAPPPLL